MDAEIIVHALTTAELNKQKEEVAWKESTITLLQEAAEKRRAWYDKQLKNER